MNKNKFAFTIIETMIALFILSTIGLLSFNSFSKITPRVDKLKFKNANLSFKHTLSTLISNPMYYDDEQGFMDLSEVEFDDKFSDSLINYEGKVKFRNLLLKELGVSVGENNRKCYMLVGSVNPTLRDICYVADNGVGWGIPDTDFTNTGVVENANRSGGTSLYVPVTIYVNSNKMETSDDFYHSAVVIGVRADGSITLLNTGIDCTNKKYKDYAQCDVSDMFASLNSK